MTNKYPVYCETCNISVKHQIPHESKESHIEKQQRIEILKQSLRRNPDVRGRPLPIYDSPPSTLQQQIRSFMDQVVLTPEECLIDKDQVLYDLRTILGRTFGKCDTFYFGSMTTGLAFEESDVDIYVKIDNFHYNPSTLNKKHVEMSKIFMCAMELYNDKTFSDIEPIFGSEVPIVKAIHVASKICCDISFKNPLGIEGCRLVKYYLDLHPRIRTAMLIIKYWAKIHCICSGQKSISPYAWTLLFIAYLQTLRITRKRRFVPTLLELQKGSAQKHVFNTRVDFNTNLPFHFPNNPQFSLMGLLEGFFNHYKDFPFGKKIASPVLGRGIDVNNPQKVFNNNREMKVYKMGIDGCEETDQQKYVNIVQDILDHNSIISCRLGSFKRIQSCLRKAAQICRKYQLEKPAVSTVLKDLFSLNNTTGQKLSLDNRALSYNMRAVHVGSYTNRGVDDDNYQIDVELSRPYAPNRVADAVEKVLSRIMTFKVTPFVESQIYGFECVPVFPAAWQFVGKNVLYEYVERLTSSSQRDFNSLLKTETRKKIYFRRCRSKEDRRLYCLVCMESPTVVQVTLQLSDSETMGFVEFLFNFLRTSLDDWLDTVLS